MKKIIIPFTMLLFCVHTNAQLAFTNSGNMQIHAGTSIAGFGNFTNTSSGVLINNGTLYVKDTIANNQTSMAIGTGTLHFNGSSAQVLTGTQPFRTLNLVSNNAAGIKLNTNLSVSGAHTYSGGIITTSTTPNYLVYEAGSTYSGDGDARHVNGWVKKFGSTNFIFPVGNGTVERTIALSSLSGASEFNVTYLPTTPNKTQLQFPIREVDKWEYWPIGKVSGGTASVTMNWNFAKVYFPNYIIADIVTGGYNGSVWASNGGTASGNSTTTGTITSSSISNFNLFTFASKSYVLPLALIDFTAKRQDKYTLINWSTEKEFNVAHFNVERSDDGVSFYNIARVTGRNSGKTEQYSARDNAPIRRIAYYRLRITDQDGSENFSRIIAVTDDRTSDELLLLTNPVQNKITLLASSSLSGEFSYQLSMMNGQLVQHGSLLIRYGGQYDIILNGKLQKGTYSLKVTNLQQSFYYKIIVL
jgi:hypothetical protein